MSNVILHSILPSAPASSAAEWPAAGKPDGPVPFAGLFHAAINNARQLEQQATGAVDGLMRGNGVDVHAAMIATEKADLAFELALSVRNKAVDAYQQMMALQF